MSIERRDHAVEEEEGIRPPGCSGGSDRLLPKAMANMTEGGPIKHSIFHRL